MCTKTFRTRLTLNRLECREVAAGMTASFTIPEGPLGPVRPPKPSVERPAILLQTKIVASEAAPVLNRDSGENPDQPPPPPMLDVELIGEAEEEELEAVVATNEDGTPINF